MADLISQKFDVIQEPLKAGDLFDLELNILNRGLNDADSFDVDFYISTNQSISTSDTLIGSTRIDGIAAGSSATRTIADLGLPALNNPFWQNGNGKYYFGAIVDSHNEVVETDESNNINTRSVRGIDEVKLFAILSQAFGIVDSSTIAGNSIDVFYDLKNITDVTFENLNVDFYLSTNDFISVSDYKIGSETIASLAGSSSTGNIAAKIDLPDKTAPFWRIKGNGTYHIGVLVNNKNPANQLDNFKNDSNKQFSDRGTLQVTVPDLVDLTGSSFDVTPDFVVAGDTIEVKFNVENLQSGTAGPFDVDFYLSGSEREWISTDDLKLGSYTIDSLGGESESGILTASFTLPDGTNDFWLNEGNGTYMVGMSINPTEEFVNEKFYRSNNKNQQEDIDYSNFKVSIPTLVDLSTQFLDVTTETYNGGDTIDVDFAFYNREVGDAGNFTVDFYLSDNNFISTGDTKIGSRDFTGLAGKSLTGILTESLQLPTDLPSGDRYIGIIIDSKKEIKETNERNNLNQGETIDIDRSSPPPAEANSLTQGEDVDTLEAILQSQSDLLGFSFDVVNEPLEAGKPVNVAFSILNNGRADSGSFTVDIYASSDESIATNDFKLGSYTVDNVAGYNKSGEIEVSYDLPDEDSPFWLNQGSGAYFVGAVIDSKDEVIETNENNNSNQAETFDYEGVKIVNNSLVDLTGTHLKSVQDRVTPGGSFDIGFTVANQGPGTTDRFNVDFYISTNDYISGGDYKLGSYGIDGGLTGNSDTGLLSNRFQLPGAEDAFWQGSGGTYYVGMIIDPENDIAEFESKRFKLKPPFNNNSNRGESIDKDAVEVGGFEGETSADLLSIEFNVIPEEIEAGEKLDVEYKIYNQGGSTAEQFSTNFYIFTEDYLNNHDNLSISDAPEVYPLFGDRLDSLRTLDGLNGSGLKSTSLDIPTDWDVFTQNGDGYYYIGMALDQFEDVVESNETNNSLTGEFVDYERVYIDV
jgi:subtilase family serine protease